ncbi:MAG: hypothetical protein AABY26_03980 [Nanoarchaeota archaeon]
MKELKGDTYKCKECGLVYREKSTAGKCQAWCKKYKSCNLKITKDAINKNQM